MSAITPAIRPAIGPAIRSAFDGGAPQVPPDAIRDENNLPILDESGQFILEG